MTVRHPRSRRVKPPELTERDRELLERLPLGRWRTVVAVDGVCTQGAFDPRVESLRRLYDAGLIEMAQRVTTISPPGWDPACGLPRVAVTEILAFRREHPAAPRAYFHGVAGVRRRGQAG